LQIENLDHSDFIPLRDMLIRTHLQDLKDVTNNVHYENYRCRKLAGVAGAGTMDKIPNKVRKLSKKPMVILVMVNFFAESSGSDGR
jgi:septin family protein